MSTYCPYAFSATTRADQIAAILTNDRGNPRRSYNRFFFNWNVKITNVNKTRPEGKCVLDHALDEAWRERLNGRGDYDILSAATKDAQRLYVEGFYMTYPGDDQGDWHFAFEGQSCGHLCLLVWRDRDLTRFDSEDLNDPEKWSDGEIADFYKGLVCCDSDLTPAKASKNVEYCFNWIRSQWEEKIKAERDARDSALA